MIINFDSNYWQNEILNICQLIDKNIETTSDRELLSANIVSHLRDLAEACSAFLNCHNKTESFGERYKSINAGLDYIKTVDKYNFINQFHDELQKTSSHYTLVSEYAERQMIRYWDYVIKIKVLMKKEFGILVLSNINKFPLDLDDSLYSFYKKIDSVLNVAYGVSKISGTHSFYIQKKKQLYIGNDIFYEYTLSNAYDNLNKFDRFITYSKIDIFPNYAIRAHFTNRRIESFGQQVEISILDNAWIAIRPCEIEHFGEIFGFRNKISRTSQYEIAMRYIFEKKLSLSNILSDEEKFNDFINKLAPAGNQNTYLLQIINSAYQFIKSGAVGANVVRYLLAIMNNTVIKNQLQDQPNNYISNLYLKNGTMVFDKLPISSSLIEHNPSVSILLNTFDVDGREPELLKRYVIKESNDKGVIYVDADAFSNKDELQELINAYNEKVYHKHNDRKLGLYGNNLFCVGNEERTVSIIEKLLEFLKADNFPDYLDYAESIVDMLGMTFDDPDKEKSVKRMFDKTSLFCIYGAAGTGKSTLISKELQLLGKAKKLCLANTHPALQNMKRKINDDEAEYLTIAKFLKNSETMPSYDVLVIDECSNVSTRDMQRVLGNVDTKLLILSGDVSQIPSIEFGNWFSVIRKFIPKDNYVELSNTFRSQNNVLLRLWKQARDFDNSISSTLSNFHISHKLDESIFNRNSDDEVILCLNYDGLYGINNINSFLQANNPNEPIKWIHYTFKVGDPIIFNDNERFNGILYNNLKGIIRNIEIESNNSIDFEIEIDLTLNPMQSFEYNGFTLLKVLPNNKSLIRFNVSSAREEDYDNDMPIYSMIPFQVAYAVSIHKAQGLEYDSVKLVVTKEVEENIHHNIFYTAITRAKNSLTIYWSPETENHIISGFSKNNINKDVLILSSKYKLKTYK